MKSLLLPTFAAVAPLLLVATPASSADEGMWLPNRLPRTAAVRSIR